MIDARTRRFQAYNVRDDEKNKTYNSDNTKNNTLLTYRWLHEKQAHTERMYAAEQRTPLIFTGIQYENI